MMGPTICTLLLVLSGPQKGVPNNGYIFSHYGNNKLSTLSILNRSQEFPLH